MRPSRQFSISTLFAPLLAMMLAVSAMPGQATTQAQVEAFLEATGFDVALDSIKLSAASAPQMVGLEAEDFGSEWTRLVNDVFDTREMRRLAEEMLLETLDDDMRTAAVDFYATDLGVRLVAAENTAHMSEDDALQDEAGAALVAALAQGDPERLELLERLNAASQSQEASLRAVQEVQVRFLLAAAAAGVIELQMDEPDLREAMRAQEGEMREAMQASSLINSAYTYQAFSNAEIASYAEALEDPDMRRVYELMNAVQFEIMANRYEALAQRMQGMRPSQDL